MVQKPSLSPSPDSSEIVYSTTWTVKHTKYLTWEIIDDDSLFELDALLLETHLGWEMFLREIARILDSGKYRVHDLAGRLPKLHDRFWDSSCDNFVRIHELVENIAVYEYIELWCTWYIDNFNLYPGWKIFFESQDMPKKRFKKKLRRNKFKSFR